jgi:phospho-N-acetylmuramoyl-pentapeptide-transferase
LSSIPFLLEFCGYAIIAFTFFLALEDPIIGLLRKKGFVQKIRSKTIDGQKATLFRKLHLKKQGTITAGGILIWLTVLLVILFSRVLSFFGIIEESLLQRGEVYLPLFTLVVVGALGFIDDWWNVREIGKKKGIEAGPKMFFLFIFALLGAFWFYFKLEYTSISIPLLGTFDIGVWVFPIFIFVVLATSNAVNITDGLDGLAGGILIQSYGIFAALSYIRGHEFLAIFCGIIIACLLAFLWFNVPPAKFFMGDTGSLALGATLAVIAAMTDTLIILPVIGFIFVVEAASVIIQLFSKKVFKKKVFKIAPIHHHFEKIGWSEPQIVMRFWLINALFAVLGFIFELVDIID